MFTIVVPALCAQTLDSGPVLHSNTRLIEVDVVAEDKKGHPVLDLTRDNFEVYDQGKIQKLRIFTKNSLESSQPSYTKASDLKNGAGMSFTNMAESRSGPGAVTIILIDSLNTKWVNQVYAREQVIKFLRQIKPDDHIAIYSMGFGRFRIFHDFTQDASELVRKLGTWNGEVKGQEVSQDSISQTDMGQELGDWLKGKSPDFVQSQHMGNADRFGTEQSLKILAAVARQLASIPGRKNLIWISEGFPLVDWSSLADVVYGQAESTGKAREMAAPNAFHLEMMMAMREISDQNVAIYPVDALCLFNPFFNTSAQDSSAVGLKALAGIHAREQAMDEIAKRTGGRAFYESNDL
jgi:VWFA-related protein